MKIVIILGVIVALFAIFEVTAARVDRPRDNGKYVKDVGNTRGSRKNPGDTGRLVLPKEPRTGGPRPTRSSSLPRYPPTQYPVTGAKNGLPNQNKAPRSKAAQANRF